MVMTDHLPRPSGSCPDLVTLWFKTLVTITTVPPGLYFDFHVRAVSDVIFPGPELSDDLLH